MPNYKNAKIYRIVCNITGENYYGSTTQLLCQRMAKHRITAKDKYHCRSKQIIDRGDCSIVLVEEYACENKQQLHARERHYIEKNACVNKTIPCQSIGEYYQKNKDHMRENTKKNWQKNKEQLSEKSRTNVTCECGCILRKGGLARHKRTQTHLNNVPA